jgi:hypothetical protein
LVIVRGSLRHRRRVGLCVAGILGDDDNQCGCCGNAAPRRPLPGCEPSAVPSGTYRASDGYLTIAQQGAQFAHLCYGIGRPVLAVDESFETFELRGRHVDALQADPASTFAIRPVKIGPSCCSHGGFVGQRGSTRSRSGWTIRTSATLHQRRASAMH